MIQRAGTMLRWAIAATLMIAMSAAAQGYSADKPLGMTAQQRPDYLAHAGLEQRLGQPLPMESQFTDETGRTGPLASWFDGKPVVIARCITSARCSARRCCMGLPTG